MRLSEDVKKLAGVDDAVVSMGTDTNRRLLQDLGLLGTGAKEAGDGDLIIAVRAKPGARIQEVMARVEQMVMAPPTSTGGARATVLHSVQSALERLPGANLAVVSLPGKQAFAPSMELLHRGLNVHLFSDHVSLDQEIKLKTYASSKGLLVMGPGAGTSIINGVGLGFANSVRRGDVGIVASAGTGIQEVSCMLDDIGLGVSAALGVGGTDVSEPVGGLMMKNCLAELERDPQTRLMMIVAKTPKEKVVRGVMEHVERRTTKPVVACFLGLGPPSVKGDRICYAKTLHSAVCQAARLSGVEAEKAFGSRLAMTFEGLRKTSKELASSLGPTRKYVRGLYSGGTLAHETLLVFRELMGEAYSNSPLSDRFVLHDPNISKENSVVDLGDEFFTAGRAHPMIDSTLRRLRIAREAKDPKAAVLLLDIVLGYGSASDPGGALAGAIRNATGSGVLVLAHICGTETDPQSYKDQSEKLRAAGARTFPSNALMAAAASLIAGGDGAATRLKAQWGDLFG
jgi:FdrA protein